MTTYSRSQNVADQWAALKIDRLSNLENTKGRFVVTAFRITKISQMFGPQTALLKPFRILIRTGYALAINWLLGIDLHWDTNVGPGLRIFHGQGLVVHRDATIGRDVTLRHNTTIGKVHDDGDAPQIGDRVDIGANAVLLGGIRIGSEASIGAGSVIVHDVEAGSVVVGNPGRVIRVKEMCPEPRQ